jgi:hypothetical protein
VHEMIGSSREHPTSAPYRKSVDELLAAFGGDAQRGPSDEEARLRLERHVDRVSPAHFRSGAHPER